MTIYRLLEEKRREYHESVIVETLDKAAKSKARRLELDAKHEEALKHQEEVKEHARQELHTKLKQRANKYTLHKRTLKKGIHSQHDNNIDLNDKNFKHYPATLSQDQLQPRKLSFHGAANVVTAVCALSRRGSSYLQPVDGENAESPVSGGSRCASAISVSVSRQESMIGRRESMLKVSGKPSEFVGASSRGSGDKRPGSPLKHITVPFGLEAAVAAALEKSVTAGAVSAKDVTSKPMLRPVKPPAATRRSAAGVSMRKSPKIRAGGQSVFSLKSTPALPVLESLERTITSLDQSTVFWDKALKPPVNPKWEKHHEKYAVMADAVLRRKHTTHKLLNLTRVPLHHHHHHPQNQTDDDMMSVRSRSVLAGSPPLPNSASSSDPTERRAESLFGSAPSSAGGGRRNSSLFMDSNQNPLIDIKIIPSIVEERAASPVRGKRVPNPPSPSRNASFIHQHPSSPHHQQQNDSRSSSIAANHDDAYHYTPGGQTLGSTTSISAPLPTRTESIIALGGRKSPNSSRPPNDSVVIQNRSSSATMAAATSATQIHSAIPNEKFFTDVAGAVIDGRYQEAEKDLQQLRQKIVSASRRASIKPPTLLKKDVSSVGGAPGAVAQDAQHQRRGSSDPETVSRPASAAANKLLELLRKSPSLKDIQSPPQTLDGKTSGGVYTQLTSPLQASFTAPHNAHQLDVDGVPLPAESDILSHNTVDAKPKIKRRTYIPLKMEDLFKTELEDFPAFTVHGEGKERDFFMVEEFDPLPPPPQVIEGHVHGVTKWRNTSYY
ncbi:UNVERIFIED_CONTAM: hypothetical protein HDU68_011817 [Siphonaria sp. JEL0065]|nr:hypothetical protein HDU68_011817 [Siphonaria sp. JEL0065]